MDANQLSNEPLSEVVADGNIVEEETVVRLRGLPFNAKEDDIRAFAEGYPIADPNGVLLLSHGDRRGEAFVRFVSTDVAIRFQQERNRQNVGERYVEIYSASNAEMEDALNDEVASGSLTKNPIVRLRGLPFVASPEDVMRFFNKIADKVIDLRFVQDADGRSTGDAFLELADEDAVKVALTKHRLLMGTRYIEVTVSSAADRETVLHVASRRCRGQRGGNHSNQNASQYGQCFPGMGFGMFPPMLPMPALPKSLTPAPTAASQSNANAPSSGKAVVANNGIPQPTVSVQIGKAAASAAAATQAAQAAASFMMRAAMFGMVPPPFPMVLGSMPPFVPPMMPMIPPVMPMTPSAPRPQSRFIVRVRGLPFSATEATVAEFFNDVRIPPQGVHMVYNPQERPTGEAFVEVESEEDIATALEHNGAPLGHRYIEVFKSSPSDMMRLGGGSAPPLPDPFGMMSYGMFY